LTLKEDELTLWLENIADAEDYKIDKIDYNFIDAEELLKLNERHLDHNTDTDIITFDYSEGNNVLAEAFISKDALNENARNLSQSIENESLRLIAHALLHCVGYNDKTDQDKKLMRVKESFYIDLFHVKQ
jgi:rRNA maturation RNase YbeY